MDHHHQHHNHHQSWRPHAIQGNICPTCNISHFPFCPPHPPPSVYSAPNLDPNSRIQPIFNNPGDPYYDPSYSNRNPSLSNFGNVNRGQYGMQNPGYGDVVGYMGNDCRSNNNFDDRSSKRLRVDGNYHGLYGGEGDGGFTLLSNYPGVEGERRLNLVHDHGVPNSGFGYGGDRRGYGLDNSGFERGVDGLDRGIPNDFGVRRAGNVEMSNPAGVGPGMHYQRDGLEQQMGYGSPYGARRGGSDVGNKFQYHDQPVAQYGQVAKPPDPRSFHQGGIGHDNDRHSHAYHHPNSGISHGLNENFHGNYMESLQSNNGPLHYDQRSNMPTLNHYPSSHPPLPSRVQQPGQLRYDYGSPHHFSDARKPIETRPPPSPIDGHMVPPGGNHAVPPQPHYGPPPMDYQGGYGNMGHLHAPQGLDLQPPLPTSPPPPLPMEPPVCWPADHKPLPSPPRVSSSLFPVHVDSSAPVHSSHAPILESHARATSHQLNSQFRDMSHDLFQGDPQGTLTSYGQYVGDGSALRLKKNYSDKPKTTDAAHLFKPPHRSSRPDHFVIILRGLPGSGKSYLAKMLRDLEVEQGGIAPRIHSMDDYFMTEVEKVEENDTSKSSSRFKKTSVKKVLEYCYEPEMEEAYRSSMLKAFKKTLEEGAFTFIIVDDRNLRVADFAQFWATAKRSGYEVYVLEAPYKDPAGCTARNIHGFTQVDVEKMAAQWEEAPPMYLQVDVKSLFHGDDLKESNIEEVDMDTEDGDVDGGLLNLDERGAKTIINSSVGDLGPFVSQKAENNWDAEAGHSGEEVKDLGRSKWSDNLDVDEDARTELTKGKPNVLSGLNKKYGREGKSVYWGDQGGHTGFSIGAVKKANIASLVIGPGAGYNLKTNPLPEEDLTSEKSGETKKLKKFQEKLRAEQESFKAVFDRRRQRIGGLDADED